MKKNLVLLSLVFLVLSSCSKKVDSLVKSITNPEPAAPANPTTTAKDYIKYTIAQGSQYCDRNGYQQVKISDLVFKVKFDSSAIYKTVSPGNQKDINKLLGFSDNNAQHHEFSARFGWRWSNDSLRLFAYTYNNSVLSIKELGTVDIGVENSCSIKVSGDSYIFSLNGKSHNMLRAATTATAEGYKLYPYFGGDERAPHAISIWIKEL